MITTPHPAPLQTSGAPMPDGDLQVLTFDIGPETLALEAGLVQEIVDLLPVTRVPGAPAVAAAVVNFRGRIIPLVDLRVAFAIPSRPPTIDSRIIVIETEAAAETILCGLLADKVHEVRLLDQSAMESAPVVGLRWPREMIRRLVRQPDGIVILPEIGAILAAILTDTPQ